MPTIEENKKIWNNYDWKENGDEWSVAFGSTDREWRMAINPRIPIPNTPYENILEIGCGFGRWTQYLAKMCKHLTAVDLSEKCIAGCSARLNAMNITNVSYYQNDGLHLPKGKKYDLVFSFDSLVHADKKVMESYIEQLNLSKNGVAFLHHSNLADCEHTDFYAHSRDPTVSAKIVAKLVKDYSYSMISQELINWGSIDLIDCITIFTNRRSDMSVPIPTKRTNYLFFEGI